MERRAWFSVWAGLALWAAPAAAADIDGLQIGKVIHGPPTAEKDLAGKVVLVDFWGLR